MAGAEHVGNCLASDVVFTYIVVFALALISQSTHAFAVVYGERAFIRITTSLPV